MRNLNYIQEMMRWNPRRVIAKINELIKAVNKLTNLSGDGMVRVEDGPAGMTVGLNWGKVLEKIPRNPIFFCSLTSDISYSEGSYVAQGKIWLNSTKFVNKTIYFRVIGGGAGHATGSVLPNLGNGDYIAVQKTINTGVWVCVQNLQAVRVSTSDIFVFASDELQTTLDICT